MPSNTNPLKAVLLHLDSFLVARPEVATWVATQLAASVNIASKVATLAAQVHKDSSELASVTAVASTNAARLATLAESLHSNADHLARLLRVNLERSSSLATLPRTPRLAHLAPELRQFLAGLADFSVAIQAWPITAEIFANLQRDFAEYESLLASSQAEQASVAAEADDVPALLLAEHDFILFARAVVTAACEVAFPQLLPEVRLYRREKVVKAAEAATTQSA